ncbi:translocation/assembly module TamB domain-containing protein [Cognatishimia sp. F0-27]|uniref:translocation/assembly module TamB domain-containing protein n=1 Tax=Cognatishimia sp. F0-27 TaxID=2816855 RepID=UPI001D0C1730|nr:translocation/assembly module TamB domain-containing protein [Cognatishimia sp. F0-27]MCC1492875.1 translocation/assembly module TamB domain-containing protein [Cognatishimia sp. F0-27]
MKRFASFFFIFMLLLPMSLSAQSREEEDRGFIQGLLEDALSGAGRQVLVEGFEGALSSRATISRITIADSQGVWLTAEDIAMVWTRRALLAGRIEIDEISIDTITMTRAPVAEEPEISYEASGAFSLPELPVSVQIARMAINRVELDETVIGQPVAFSISGNAALEDGEGDARLEIDRLDAGGGLRLAGSYSNGTRVLSLDLGLEEPQGGIAATLLNLPGAPSVALSVQGEDPIADFVADIRLATDGQDRVTGTVELITEPTDAGNRERFRVALNGDVAPVVAPQYSPFLGDAVRLLAEGQRNADGSMELTLLDIGAQALELSGSAALEPGGWPRAFDLSATIVPPSGDRVVLPIPGDAPVSVRRAELTARFDAATGDRWALDGRLQGLDAQDVRLGDLTLDGSGSIARATQVVSGVIDIVADQIATADVALSQTIGDRLTGQIDFGWQEGGQLRIHKLDLAGADYGLTGAVSLTAPGEGAGIRVRPDLTLFAQRLDRFAPLIPVALGGSAELAIAGEILPLTGAFDVSLSGGTVDLSTGIAQVDPLLEGAGTLVVQAVRDTAGIRVTQLEIGTDAAEITGRADISTGESSARLTAQVANISVLLPSLSGQANLVLEADQAADRWNVRLDGGIPRALDLGFEGVVAGDGTQQLIADGRLSLSVAELSAFSDLVGRPLGGAFALTADADVDLLALAGSMTANGSTRDLRVDIPQVDGLLRGNTQFSTVVSRNADGVIRIGSLDINGDGVVASAAGASDLSVLRADISLPETQRVVPGLTGPSRFTLRADEDGAERWIVRADGQFPGDARLTYDGTLVGDLENTLRAQGNLSARIDTLSRYSSLAGRNLSGSAQLSGTIDADVLAQTGRITVDGETQALRFAVPAVEPLIRGTTRIALDAARDAQGVLSVDRLILDGPGIEAGLTGTIGENSGDLDFRVALPNLGAVVPQLPGAASMRGTARKSGANWQIAVDGQGPAGITLNVAGTASEDAQRLNLDVTGGLPLSVVSAQLPEQAIDGQVRFDLDVVGPPQLNSVSGQITLADVRAFAPALDLGIEGGAGAIRLAGGQAQVDLSAGISSGGTLRISGPIALDAPFSADLVAAFQNARLRDDSLYDTTANGRVTVTGPLTGGARIGGTVSLETLELRIPQGGPNFAILEGVEHRSMPEDVRLTLVFAGLREQGTQAPAPDFPIDVLVNAPNRIFVRGRGLDAELGGQLRLTGSTNDLVPVGQFNLIRGRIDLLGRRVVLTEGGVSLRGSFDPYITFTAATDVDETEISIRLEGFASEPDLIVTSSPELPEDEVISLFLFGRSIQEISALQAVQLAAAVNTLSGRGGLGITGQLREGLGVDDLDIGTDADGNIQARAGAYISENIYTDLTVNSKGESQINLNLDLTEDVTVRGRLGSDGDSGIGIFFERDY